MLPFSFEEIRRERLNKHSEEPGLMQMLLRRGVMGAALAHLRARSSGNHEVAKLAAEHLDAYARASDQGKPNRAGVHDPHCRYSDSVLPRK